MNTEAFDLNKSALIVYNMQKANPCRYNVMPKILPNIKRLIDVMHEKGLPVIYGCLTALPYEYQSKYFVHWLSELGNNPKEWVETFKDGSEGVEVIDELKPDKRDLVMKKLTASFFVGTNLEVVLRNRGIYTIILTGVTTDHGIESTARHGTFLGLSPVIVEDAVGTTPNREQYGINSLKVLKDVFKCEVVRTDEILSEMRK